jgi:hypothetical protein
MTTSVHERRVEQEWKLLLSLAAENPEILQDCVRQDQVDGTVFRFRFLQTQALVEEGDQLRIVEQHNVTLRFPRFFPSVPIEASLAQPVFHPNVHPEIGFVCLWNRFSSGDTVIEAVRQLQKVISWELHNEEPDHMMQPRAVEWFRNSKRSTVLLFSIPKLKPKHRVDLAAPSKTRRLSTLRGSRDGMERCSADSGTR